MSTLWVYLWVDTEAMWSLLQNVRSKWNVFFLLYVYSAKCIQHYILDFLFPNWKYNELCTYRANWYYTGSTESINAAVVPSQKKVIRLFEKSNMSCKYSYVALWVIEPCLNPMVSIQMSYCSIRKQNHFMQSNYFIMLIEHHIVYVLFENGVSVLKLSCKPNQICNTNFKVDSC